MEWEDGRGMDPVISLQCFPQIRKLYVAGGGGGGSK